MGIDSTLLDSFEKWLSTLGYAESTVYASGRYTRDFFFYLETNKVNSLEAVSPETIRDYHRHLLTRRNKTKPGSLSNNYIISNINALKRFSKYLQETGKGTLEIGLQLQATAPEAKTILTLCEIRALYRACGNGALGIRDRAILSVYYGCGLRKSEGTNLDVKDVLLKEKRLYVRKGKNYKERYVPMTGPVKEDLEDYIVHARERIAGTGGTKDGALFLSMRGKRMHGNSLTKRLHQLMGKANTGKETGLHSLRHSIATHLLQSGLALEEVSQFLGHASLESTQIYTHLSNE